MPFGKEEGFLFGRNSKVHLLFPLQLHNLIIMCMYSFGLDVNLMCNVVVKFNNFGEVNANRMHHNYANHVEKLKLNDEIT